MTDIWEGVYSQWEQPNFVRCCGCLESIK